MEERETIYRVVVNQEEQYSISPVGCENALGWRDAGKGGSKVECLAFIQEIWTDMRPLSLRKMMEKCESGANPVEDSGSEVVLSRQIRNDG